MTALRKGFRPVLAVAVLAAMLGGCGRSQDTSSDPINAFPRIEGAYGTSMTIGDLEAHIIPQLVTSPDPPGRGIEYDKYQDRREVVNSVTVRVPVNEPDTLGIHFYIESRQDWTFHDMPVVTRSRIFVEETDPLTEQKYRTLVETHDTVHGQRLRVEDSLGLVFDYMQYRDRFGDVVTLIAETDVLLMEPGTPLALVNPILASAPVNARTEVRSNPLRIEFTRRLLPPDRPIILLPEEDDAAAAENEGAGDSVPDADS